MSKKLTNQESKEIDSFQPISESALSRRFLKNPRISILEITPQILPLQLMEKRDKSFCHINFRSSSPSVWTIQNLQRALKFVKKVKEIDIFLGYSWRVSSLASTSEKFKGLTLLKSIRFEYSFYFKMKNNALDHISRGLKRRKYLRKIRLDLYLSLNPTDTGFQNLLKSLKRSIRLQKIDLRFPSLWKMIDLGLSHLSRNFKGLTS